MSGNLRQLLGGIYALDYALDITDDAGCRVCNDPDLGLVGRTSG